jgi:hypothetical protein
LSSRLTTQIDVRKIAKMKLMKTVARACEMREEEEEGGLKTMMV